jgi:hypothetical protein
VLSYHIDSKDHILYIQKHMPHTVRMVFLPSARFHLSCLLGSGAETKQVESLMMLQAGFVAVVPGFAKVAVNMVPCSGFVFLDCQTVDVEESGDSVNHQKCPVHVDDKGVDKVQTEVPKLKSGTDGWESKIRQVRKDGTANQRN